MGAYLGENTYNVFWSFCRHRGEFTAGDTPPKPEILGTRLEIGVNFCVRSVFVILFALDGEH